MNPDELEKKYNELNTRFKNMESKTNKILDSYNDLFNTIFIDYELKSKGLLKKRHDLLTEMLLFINNICEKHNIKWWINYGSLLGAYRHNGFIPWDDDMDISMTRSDYDKFMSVIDKEITENNLSGILSLLNGYKVNDKFMIAFPSLICELPEIIKEESLKKQVYNIGFIDIFPFDFVSNPDEINNENYTQTRNEFYIELLKDNNKNELIEKYYEKLNLSLQKTSHLIPGVDGVHGIGCDYPLMKFNYELIFPLDTVIFNGMNVPCPNNCKDYLKSIYGKNYLNVPKLIHHHNALSNTRDIKNVELAFETQIEKIKKINQKFDLDNNNQKKDKNKRNFMTFFKKD